MTDPIAEALDAFVPAFDCAEGDWQAILKAASLSALSGSATPLARPRFWKRAPFARRAVRVAIAFAVFALLTTGVAWAAGAFSSPTPSALFGSSSANGGPADTGAGGIFAGPLVPGSVNQVASVNVPKVGAVALWHAVTTKGGWCSALRLSDGYWLDGPGQGSSRKNWNPLDGGGSIPGCFPTGVIDGGNHHLEWLENDINAHSVGGSYWRIRSGVITVPGAVKVTDLTTGTSTNVVDGNVFLLAIEAPNPSLAGSNSPVLHLVAYDKDGNVIASDGN
jgi:hypothetical protein